MKKLILSILTLVGGPLVLGALVFLLSQSEVAFEMIMLVSGFLELIFFSVKISRFEKKNMKENKTIKKDKKSDMYKVYRTSQLILLISGVLNLVFSYLVFVIFGG